MSGKKGMKHFDEATIKRLNKLKEAGLYYNEIAGKVGLNYEQVIRFFERQRKRERKIANGWIPKPKGRPKKTLTPEERIQELEREIELLKAFLHAAGRRWEQK